MNDLVETAPSWAPGAKSGQTTGSMLIVAGLTLGVVGWASMRSTERKKLVQMLENDPQVVAVRDAKLVRWTPESKAEDLILYTNTVSAAKAFEQVLATLPKIPPPPTVIDQVKEQLEEATGLNLDEIMKAVDQYTKNSQARVNSSSWSQFIDSVR